MPRPSDPKSSAGISTAEWPFAHSKQKPEPDSENGLAQKQRTPRRRCQEPKMLSSPEDTMYYNQLNGTLEYQGSKRKPRKLGQIKMLDGEDEYYKSLTELYFLPPKSVEDTFIALTVKGKE
ncbi:hypothetical protein AB1E18_001488 [Capra hircus]